MERVIRDGKVAVIYSPGFGAGWYSWHRIEALLFDSSVVSWIESKELDKIESYLILKYPDVYIGKFTQLQIKWVPVGYRFRIDEYDGNETIVLKEEDEWIIA